MEYIYLTNKKRARSLAFVLSSLSILLTIINIILLLTGSKRTVFINWSIAVNMASIMILLIFCMHYLWANNKNERLNVIMHIMQLHLLFTIFALFVGKFSSFSYTFIHGLLASSLFSLLYVLIDKKFNIVLLVFISLIAFSLTLFQIKRVIDIALFVFALMLIVISLMDKKKNMGFLFSLTCGIITAVISLLSAVGNYELCHVIMHFSINNACLLLTAVLADEKKEEM